MKLIEIYKELNSPIKKSYAFYENRLYLCFYEGHNDGVSPNDRVLDLCTGKTSKDAESKFRQKHHINMNEKVMVPFRVMFLFNPDDNKDISDEELDTKLHDVEFIATKHTEYDFGYYSELATHLSFICALGRLISDVEGLNIYCHDTSSYHYIKRILLPRFQDSAKLYPNAKK